MAWSPEVVCVAPFMNGRQKYANQSYQLLTSRKNSKYFNSIVKIVTSTHETFAIEWKRNSATMGSRLSSTMSVNTMAITNDSQHWSILEKLLLAQCVYKFGEDNWPLISKTLRQNVLTHRSQEFYNQKVCRDTAVDNITGND